MDYDMLSKLLYPEVKLTVEDILKRYPPRNLKFGQVVSRYAPSPTGYMHLGNFFQMFISYNLARVSDGILFLRLEDTDAKRYSPQATKVIFEILKRFEIPFDEYPTLQGESIGDYGPYIQSQRKEIYEVFAKKLVKEGKAFPCFCGANNGKEEILKERESKFIENDEFEYDSCRDLSYEQIKKLLNDGKSFALRLKTKNTGKERVKFTDLIKGEIEAKANAKDFVIIKSDGVPPYPFAHVVDDTLMGTTVVVRGEEYLSSTPMHLELFESLGFKSTTYCHNPLICKLDENGNRRKVSKRYDPEADMRFYFQEGYPKEGIIEYLLNIINSGFENWRNANPDKPWQEFTFGVNDITAVAPIFDIVKFNDVCKNIISRFSAKKLCDEWLNYAEEFDKPIYNFIKDNRSFTEAFLNIDREVPKPRKDIYNYKMIKSYYSYMLSKPTVKEIEQEEEEKYREFIKEYSRNFNMPATNEEWFAGVKAVAQKLGYATDNKEYKKSPESFKGNTAKACEFVRIALTGRKNSPNLFEIINVLGEKETRERLNQL